MVRLPDGMRDKIAAAAKEGGRSMNAEIVQRLEQSFNLSPVVVSGSDEMIDQLSEEGRKYFFIMYKTLLEMQGNAKPPKDDE